MLHFVNPSPFRQQWMPKILAYNYTTYTDPLLRRQFKFMSRRDHNALPTEKLNRLTEVINNMSGNYGKVRICSYQDPTKCDMQLEPGNAMCMIMI